MKLTSHHRVVLEAGRASKNYWLDLWNYRGLFEVLARRDIAVRYKQTLIGVAWAILRPLVTALALTVVFKGIANLPSDPDVPYALMVFCGMLPWIFFSTALSEGSNSLVANANLISKIYFPRLILPVAAIIVAFVDLVVGLGALAIMLFWYQFAPSWHLIFLPFFIGLAFLASAGPALWIGALNVSYRDFKYVVPFVVQFGLYVTPVGFSSAIIPEKWRLLFYLNPMAGIVDGFRWAILGGESHIDWTGIAISVTLVFSILWFGILQFRAAENRFADVI